MEEVNGVADVKMPKPMGVFWLKSLVESSQQHLSKEKNFVLSAPVNICFVLSQCVVGVPSFMTLKLPRANNLGNSIT